jgi:hypothetical protein
MITCRGLPPVGDARIAADMVGNQVGKMAGCAVSERSLCDPADLDVVRTLLARQGKRPRQTSKRAPNWP